MTLVELSARLRQARTQGPRSTSEEAYAQMARLKELQMRCCHPKQEQPETMSNQDILFNLRVRRDSLSKAVETEQNLPLKTLIQAELWYVDALIEYRERHGDPPIHQIKL